MLAAFKLWGIRWRLSRRFPVDSPTRRRDNQDLSRPPQVPRTHGMLILVYRLCDVLAGRHCSPLSLVDFEYYLAYVHHDRLALTLHAVADCPALDGT